MLLAGCSTANQVVTRTVPVLETPPPALLRPCPKPYRAVTTINDLVENVTALRGALDKCAAQVDGVRKWRDDALREFNASGNE